MNRQKGVTANSTVYATDDERSFHSTDDSVTGQDININDGLKEGGVMNGRT